jgi:hypothetical protein
MRDWQPSADQPKQRSETGNPNTSSNLKQNKC